MIGPDSIDCPAGIEIKVVKHPFTLEQKAERGELLALACSNFFTIQKSSDQIKAAYHSISDESIALIEKLSAELMNGFEMRPSRCRMEFRPKERRKLYFLDGGWAGAPPVLEEPMTEDEPKTV